MLPLSVEYYHHGGDVISREGALTKYLREHSYRWLGCRNATWCSDPASSGIVADMIPKKAPHKLARELGRSGFGIQVVVKLSLARVIAGLVLWSLISAVFIVLWLKTQHGSLEDAFIPGMLILMLFVAYVNLIASLQS